MFQSYPNDEYELRNIIKDYINENRDIITKSFENYETEIAPDLGKFEYRKPIVYFYFMKPSWDFPVYFENNKSYFKMDDYVENYVRTNNIVMVEFESKTDSGQYTIRYDLVNI